MLDVLLCSVVPGGLGQPSQMHGAQGEVVDSQLLVRNIRRGCGIRPKGAHLFLQRPAKCLLCETGKQNPNARALCPPGGHHCLRWEQMPQLS